jgi:hypothetical protein
MKRSGILVASWLLAGGGLFADTISSSFTSFNSVFSSGQPDPLPSTVGTTYWNNFSPDTGTGGSNDMNIGYALTNAGGFAGTTALLGTDSAAGTLLGPAGSDPTSFNFITNGDVYTIQVLFSDTGLPDDVTFGWYDLANPSVLNPIFSNIGNTNAPLGSPQAFNNGGAATYGFYATVCFNPPACTIDVTYRTDSTQDTTTNAGMTTPFGTLSNTPYNHFSLFNLTSNGQSYVLGLSETPNAGGTELAGDFQDLVIELTDTSAAITPEPATMSIVGLSLIALGFARRRRRG